MPTVARPDPAAYMSLIASSAAGQRFKAAALAALDVRPGDVVLELGCGPGADLPALAEATGPDGRVTAVDVDPVMVAAAQRRTADAPVVDVILGDIHALALPSAGYHRVHVDRVLQHVLDPRRAVTEIARLLRPGGVASLVEPDWALMAIDAHDLAASHAFTVHTCRCVVRNAHIGRQLPRLGGEAGLEVVSVQAYPAVFTDFEEADAVLGLTRNTLAAVSDGHLEEEQSTAWLADLAAGPFTAVATVINTVLARAPGT